MLRAKEGSASISLFVRKPTRHRTYKPQVKAHFSPSRAVVSCDFQGAICKKEARFNTRFLDRTVTTNDTVSKGILLFIPSIGSQRNEAKRANFFEILQKIFIIPPHLYKGIQRGVAQPKIVQFTNCLRLTPLLYLPIGKGIYAQKMQIISTYLKATFITK